MATSGPRPDGEATGTTVCTCLQRMARSLGKSICRKPAPTCVSEERRRTDCLSRPASLCTRSTLRRRERSCREHIEKHLYLRGKEEILKSVIGGRDWTKSVS